MNRQIASSLLFFGLIAATSFLGATMVKAEAVQWPAGKNVCQGVWSYGEYQPCEDKSHGPDLARPIIAEKDGEKCGYDKKQNSCWHGREHNANDFVDTAPEKLERITSAWKPQDLQAHCDNKGRAVGLGPQQLLGTVSVLSSKIFPKLCAEMEGRLCVVWNFRAEVQCRINIDHQVFGASDACGEYIDDLSKPKTCTIGYYNISKRSSACSSVDFKSGRGIDATELMKEDWRHKFSCSTGDDLPAETAEEVQKKYNSL